uniref:BspA family leucine-rich repeat surface protein n=1 Tax=Flavobacterium sp. TaxID=239 RepID=UPI00404A2C15
MKKNLLFALSLFFVSQISVSQDFITIWRTFDNKITFDATTVGPVSYTWQTLPPAAPSSGSGTFTTSSVLINNLPNDVSIQLNIAPQNFKRIITNPNNSLNFFGLTLENINQWGAVEWISVENAFKLCNLLEITATDTPNLSQVTSMANMFDSCYLLNSPYNLNAWDISNVTDLSGMFRNCQSFNQALSQWNTSNVTNMSGMFENAISFNLNIGNWDTMNVTNMSKMFFSARDFNRNIGNWNTSNVTDMSEMFGVDSPFSNPNFFNQNIGNWDTSAVVNMMGMFRGAKFFNKNIGNWNTSNVTNMSDMFQKAVAFNQDLGNWDVSNVTDMSGMFSNDFVNEPEDYAFANGGSLSIENWNTANVVDMSGMFLRANNFNFSLENWVLNPNVVLTTMLDRSGLDCVNYSNTLIGWSNNPNTPNNKILGATFMEYGPSAVSAVENLITNKSWGFSGHDINSDIPEFDIETIYCSGSNIPALPVISDNGIQGTWSPALNNNETATYFFTPDEGQCGSTANVTITITPNLEPLFTQVNPICSGANLPALPTTSTNGISGTWSPAINNMETTTYTFTPNDGSCSTTNAMTIVVNANAPLIFTQVAPICIGETVTLPTVSENGVSGTWSPAINNLETTTYTFTPSNNDCASTASMTIVVNSLESPVFTEVDPICPGASIAALPTTSNNGISGTWSPAINNMETTTYTFTPNAGNCSTTTTLTISINENIAETPAGETLQSFEEGATIASLLVNPSDVIWYVSNADALASLNPLNANEPLEDGVTYFAVNTNGACNSMPFAVTVSVVLSNNNLDLQSLKFYPNPVGATLQINYSKPIQSVEIYSLLGQLLLQSEFNASEVNVDVQNLPASMYLVKIKSENQTGKFKMLKK